MPESQLKACWNLASVYFFSYPFPSALSSLLLFLFFLYFGYAAQPVDSSVPRPGVEPAPLHRLRSLNHWTVSEVPELPALKPALPALSKLGPACATLSAQGAFPSCPVCRVGGPLAELPSNSS